MRFHFLVDFNLSRTEVEACSLFQRTLKSNEFLPADLPAASSNGSQLLPALPLGSRGDTPIRTPIFTSPFHRLSQTTDPQPESLGSTIPYDSNPIKEEHSDGTDSGTEDQAEGTSYELKRGLINLGIGKDYVPAWSGKDAFREAYQNWKDGIIDSFQIDARSFRPVIQEGRSDISITVHQSHVASDGNLSQRLIGFISYDKRNGRTQLSNFNAKLEAKHLSMGGSSKRSNENLAGHHGEGLKLSALLMRRLGYGVRIESSSFYWNFNFGRGDHPNLCCNLSQPSPASLARKKQTYAEQMSRQNAERPLKGNLWEDVTLILSKGKGTYSRTIEEAEFRQWLTVALDLDGTHGGSIVQTPQGDLLLEPTHSGRVYLKGLRVAGHGPDGRLYRFGYNFATGSINRDRERLMDRDEEAGMVASIWEQAILKEGDKITDAYLKLLHDEDECPDAALAHRKITRSTATILWQRLLASCDGVFFFYEDNLVETAFSSQSEMIIRDLKMQPQRLSKALWWPFRKFSLARTPQEQRMHLFNNSAIVSLSNDSFCTGITRILKGSLSLDPRLKNIDIQFVEGGQTQIDLLYQADRHVLRIHQKWIDIMRAHEHLTCEVVAFPKNSPANEDEFLCDHVAEDLLELVIDEVRGALKITPADSATLRQKARSCIRSMPRRVTVKATASADELEVCWIGNESGIVSEKYGADIQYLVALHRSSTCEARKDQLLHGETSDPSLGCAETGSLDTDPFVSPCGCPQQVVSRIKSKATFSSLDHAQAYFPLVSRLERLSFCGMPPTACRPRAYTLRTRNPKSSATVSQRNTNQGCSDVNDDDIDVHTTQSDTNELTSLPLEGPSVTNTTDFGQSHMQSRPQQEMLELQSRAEKAQLEKDKQSWQSWFENAMPLAVAKLVPESELEPREGTIAHRNHFSTGGDLECPHLDYTFKRDVLVRIELMTPVPSEYFVHIHDIIYESKGSDEPSYSLLVTKYSSYSALSLLSQHSESSGLPLDSRELVLHFRKFHKMGGEADTELVEIANITYAEKAPCVRVSHVVERPEGLRQGELFCRFGLRTSTRPDAFCITRIASRLLHDPEDLEKREYSETAHPVVYDMTPNIIGPSEGFLQARCVIDGAFDFSEEHNVTWKMRYPLGSMFDGSVNNIVGEFESGSLIPPSTSMPESPKIALIAGEHICFRLRDQNNSMPSIEQFFKPFEILIASAKSVPKPDYMVTLLSPAVLHPLAAPKFSSSILQLLERGLSIHIKICRLPEFNLRQDRIILVLITSTMYADLPWESSEADLDVSQDVGVESIIRDLAVTIPRSHDDDSTGFVCSIPVTSNGRTLGTPSANVYNHYTGWTVPDNVVVKANLCPFILGSNRSMEHPTLGRMLTVREIARLQGFDDDFVFYGLKTLQYLSVLNAIPPAVSKKIAETIMRSIRNSATVRFTNIHPTGSRKRVRVNDPESEA